MKITVRVDDEWYEVEVGDLYARPVIAAVDGEYFEVWPEIGPSIHPKPSASDIRAAASQENSPTPASKSATSAKTSSGGYSTKSIYAPIPGVIVSIAVSVGSTVAQGDELCVLEAMKMKNQIRAPRAGTISRIAVAINDHVQHHDVLFDYAD